MMQYVKRFFISLFLGANVVTVLLLWLCCAFTWLSPAQFSKLSVITLVFPAFLLANLFFLVFWLLFKARFVLLPLLGMLAVWGYVMDYCPVQRVESTPEDSSLFVVSYNMGQIIGEEKHTEFIRYVKQTDADVWCMQEVDPSLLSRKIFKQMVDSMDYKLLQEGNRCVMTRIPVVGDVKTLLYETKHGNGTMICSLLYRGDTLLILNNHLESYALTDEERSGYKNVLKSPTSEGVSGTGMTLARRISEGTRVRGVQADSLCAFLERNAAKDVIVCGDFNDTPISYTYQQIANRLQCAWRESGCGVGLSYNQVGFFVRIDHLFHSPGWESHGTRIDDENTLSDHYPLLSFLRKTSN